ncbi:MAG: FAD-dependent oxidoreductase [Actinomycetota bacterium]|nr:FAD-dependent oxidoreductase [Actinomycetota bacterium]
MREVLIVGAGQAGLQIAVSLREGGFDGRVTIVGTESYTPYQRPPLSKTFLHGEADVESLELRSAAFYEEHRIDLVCGETVTAIEFDGTTGRATTDTGRVIGFDALALATGSEPRRLSIEGAELDGVLSLRDIDDAVELKRRWDAARNVVVIGGGFIGLEVAAGATKDGKRAVVLEALDRLIARAVSPEMSEFLRSAHERRGTTVRLGVRIVRLVGEQGRVIGVELDDGEVIPADVVMVGIGVVPRVHLAEMLGLECINGAVVVDEYARTSRPGIVAAGDSVLLPHPLGSGVQVRLESVQNAVDQARIAASTLLGELMPYTSVPWFWSDQADLKLQIAGLSTGYDSTVVRGDPDSEQFSVLYFRDDRLIAIDTVNHVHDYLAAKRALAAGQTVSALAAADASVALKTLVVD